MLEGPIHWTGRNGLIRSDPGRQACHIAVGTRRSRFPRNGARIVARAGLVKAGGVAFYPGMVTRADILVLGLTAGVVGCLVGGLMLGVGLGLVVNRVHAGWVLVLPAAPVAGMLGYVFARKLAKQLPK